MVPRGFAFRSSREDLGGLKLTGDLRDKNTDHLERKATKRRDSIYGNEIDLRLMFLDNNSLRSCSPWKNVKGLFQKKDDETWESLALHYFLVSVFVFCGYGLYFWILFQFCGLILYFFVCVSGWECLFPYWDLCFCFLVVFFCFGFPFCLMCFCFGFVLSYFCCCCCCLVGFLFLSATLYIW